MAKGFRESLGDELRNLGISKKLIRRLIPRRGNRWNKISRAFDDLVKLIAYRIRVDLENGGSVRPKLVLNCINAIRGTEDIPDSSDLEILDCSTSSGDSDVDRQPKSKKRFSSTGSVPVVPEVLEIPEVPERVTRSKRKRDEDPDASPSKRCKV